MRSGAWRGDTRAPGQAAEGSTEVSMVRYRIYHPDDAPSSPNPRTALIAIASDARDEMGEVTMEGDASVIERVRAMIAERPGGPASVHWLTRATPIEMRYGTTIPMFLAFRPELVSGE